MLKSLKNQGSGTDSGEMRRFGTLCRGVEGALKIRAGGKDFINSVYDSRPFLIIICNRITIYQTPVFIINSIDCIKIMNLQGSIWVSSKCAKSKFNLIESIQIERYSMGFHLPLRFCVKNGYVEIHWAFSKNI